MFAWAPLRRTMLATTALVPFGIAAALANPLGPNVVGGGAIVSGVGTSNVTINQTTPRAIINWHTFNIGAGETTRFIQPNASSVALNRVTGGIGPSMINGVLTANGQVYLVNPNGVLIGKGGMVNTAGFLATTFDITNDNFMAGRYKFDIPGNPSASVVNEGRINAHSQGFAALVAPGVRNSGTIVAKYGTIGLASSGNGFSLDFYGDRLISLAVGDQVASTVFDVATGQPLTALVKNEGKLKANGGRVELTAASARTVVDAVINNTGVIEARTVGTRAGKIVLGGPTAATKVAGLPTQTVKVSGKLDVSAKRAGGKGGTIEVTGEKIVVQAATFDASGPAGGGKVLIGGDTGGGHGHWATASIPQAALEARALSNATTVEVDAATVINASATSVGSGGKVIVWADGDTTFAGTILARGGSTSGDGGFVEVSGKQTLGYSGLVNAGATHGKNGTLLLDPLNATLSNVAGPGVILVSSIVSALQSSDVIVTTGAVGNEAGDMFVNAPIVWSTANDLWLEAHRHIYVNAHITNTSGAVQNEIILQADKTGTGVGTLFFAPGTQISTAGEVHLAFNATFPGIKYVAPNENFSGFVTAGAGLTQYMLINSVNDMLAIGNNLAGNYVLSRDLDMSGVTGFTPFGVYTGQFEGLGHTISGLNISSGLSNVGLFQIVGVTGEIHELVLKDFVVTSTATGGPVNIGTLAGTNSGLIDGVNIINTQINAATGPVSQIIGGLVGTHASGQIFESRASGIINAPGLSGATIGGLVGTSNALIMRSFSLGSINADNNAGSTIGGFVGANNDTLADVYSRGNISALNGDNNTIGGLVGESDANIIRSYATGMVTTTGSINMINVGNLVGEVTGGSVTNSFYLSPTPGAGPGVNRTDSELKTLALATLFGGPATPPWTRTAGYGNDYPHFQYETQPFRTGTFFSPASNEKPEIPNSVQAPPDFRNSPVDPQLPGPVINLVNFTPGGPIGPGGGPRGVTGPQPGAILRSLAPVLPQRPTCGAGGQCTSFATLLPPGQYVPNQVVVQIPQNTPPQVLQQILQQLGLTVLGTTALTNGNSALNLQLPAGVSIRDIILRLEQNQVVAVAQANMTYGLVQQVPAAIAPFTASRGDPAQYSMGKLNLNEAHRVASGNSITVAVIDSEVDAEHVELKGTIAQTYDATDTQARAHSHGTAMAGAIVSRDRLLGVAPGARILAIRAFSETQTSAESTTFTILKGIEYAINQGARVINMSFAGPYDPSLERALKDAAGRGIVLIGASGNAGPKSPPLWPGADPNVIAVTATDSGDRVFRQANRGPYISVASPGVEILAPAPAGYQMSTGTSIATAHVSGVVALMLERDPSLTPQEVRLILESTANDLGPRGKDQQFGWGMVNPARALAMVDERKRQKTSGAPAPARQR